MTADCSVSLRTALVSLAGVSALLMAGCSSKTWSDSGSDVDAPADGTGSAADSDLPMDTQETPEQRLGPATMGGSGRTTDRYHTVDVTRDGRNYKLMANGWGPRFGSQTLSYSGTSFNVESMLGDVGDQFQPATYPTVFCGRYSRETSRPCGLPAAIDSLSSLRTGWSWAPNGNEGQYNAAYDIWLANGSDFTGFLMVWLREPPGQRPAGEWTGMRGEVANVPGNWDLWVGTVGNNGRPIINYARTEGEDTYELEFDILDFVRDAEARGLTLPGTHVLSVAVGFEIWQGPVNNLESIDFYVDPQQ